MGSAAPVDVGDEQAARTGMARKRACSRCRWRAGWSKGEPAPRSPPLTSFSARSPSSAAADLRLHTSWLRPRQGIRSSSWATHPPQQHDLVARVIPGLEWKSGFMRTSAQRVCGQGPGSTASSRSRPRRLDARHPAAGPPLRCAPRGQSAAHAVASVGQLPRGRCCSCVPGLERATFRPRLL